MESVPKFTRVRNKKDVDVKTRKYKRDVHARRYK